MPKAELSKGIEKTQICISEAVIETSNGVLLLKRSKANDLYVNKWQLPGGKSEPGESPLDTIKREVLEETDCGCSSIKLLKQVSFSSIFRGKKSNVLLSVYSCEIEGKIRLSGDHSATAFIPKKEIASSSLAPISKKALFD
jgi:8-oxo-dGTP diphosphatase